MCVLCVRVRGLKRWRELRAAAWRRRYGSESGAALVMAMLVMMLGLAISGGLVALSMLETRLSTMERERLIGRALGEVQLERVLQELSLVADWSGILSGVERSAFFGAENRPRIAGGEAVDLESLTTRLNGEGSVWGADAPRWRLYAHGWVTELLEGFAVRGGYYSAVWVADDEGDGDGRAEVDGNGVVGVRVELYGPFELRQVWLATVRRVRSGVALVSLRAPP